MRATPKRRLAVASLACALTAFPSVARADLFSSLSYGAHVSTIGDGITLEKPLLYDFSARIATGNASVSQQFSFDGTPYVSTTKYGNVALIADFRPSGGRYRISGGLVAGNDRVDFVARNDATNIRVGNGLYPIAGTGAVTGRVAFNRPSIYAGLGTGTGLIRGLTLSLDAGVLVRNGTATTAASGPLLADPAFRADLGRLQSEFRTRVVVPVLSLGVTFRP
jgi:hypothetical protein